MDFTYNTVSKMCVFGDSFGFSHISKDSLITKQQRLDYLSFIINNQNLPPIKKIFGTEIDFNPTTQQIHAQTKKLYRVIHPDKVPEDEKPTCTKLFQLVKEMEKTATEEPLQRLEQLGGLAQFGLDTDFFLAYYIQGEKWLKALEVFSSGPNNQNGSPSLWGSLIHARLGKLPEALNLLPSNQDILRGLWEECQTLFTSLTGDPDQRHTITKRMIILMNEMNSTNTANLFNINFQVCIVPYDLPLRIAENLIHSNDKPIYEKYLREAIRYCPDGLDKIKQELIEQLKDHIKKYHKENFETVCKLDTKKEINVHFQSCLKKIALGLEHRLPLISQLIKSNRLNEAVSKMTEALEPSSWTLWSAASYIFSICKPLEEDEKKSIEGYVNLLKGFISYFKNDKRQATHHFLLANRPLLAGLALFDEHEYSHAIALWNESVDERGPQYTYQSVNYCDTLFVHEDSSFTWKRLKNVSEEELRAIKSMYIPIFSEQKS